MNDLRKRAGWQSIVLLGTAQILIWGGSFFLLAVLADPIVKETAWSRQAVYGALSLSILIAGALAPATGRHIARNGGRRMLCVSGAVAALGLLLLAASHTLLTFYLAWVLLGVAMSFGLYEALFATLAKVYGMQAKSAIVGITLISGFCTTLTWPAIALLVQHLGWRGACYAYAGILVIVIAPLYLTALPGDESKAKPEKKDEKRIVSNVAPRLYFLVSTIFTLAAVIMAAMSVFLISILESKGYSLVAAIALGGLLGPSQVGVRLVDLAVRKGHPIWTTFVSVVLTFLGLTVLALMPELAIAGVVLYGAGNGLRAIVRGTLPLAISSPGEYPVLLGRMARPSLIGQAATPLAGGWFIEMSGVSAMLWLICSLALINLFLTVLAMKYIKSNTVDSGPNHFPR